MTLSDYAPGIVLPSLSLPLQDSSLGLLEVESLQLQSEAPPITTQFLQAMRDFLAAQDTMEAYRASPKYFTRKRCFSFPALAVTLLKDHSAANQSRLDALFQVGAFGSQETCPTASAFCQARLKILPAFFQAWTEQGVQFFYAQFPQEQLVETWHGHLLFAVDTTKLHLPDTPETRELFSIQTNQCPGEVTVQGQASFVFDVLNGVPVHTCFGAVQGEKRFLVDYHAPYLGPGKIAIYDRGYEDYAVAAATVAAGADFVIRCKRSHGFKAVQDFVDSGATDEIITIQVTPRQKALVVERGWPLEMQVRLLKVSLEDGNFEVLMTSLLDRSKYPAADFQELYDKRWGVETAFKRFKHQLKVEVFSSKKASNIEQDFYGVVFLLACEAILDQKEDHDLRARTQEKGLKYEYQVNKARAYAALSTHLVALFLREGETLDPRLLAYQASVRLGKSEIRKGRKFPRPKLTPTQRLNHHLYVEKGRC